jgi:hypothetical protein
MFFNDGNVPGRHSTYKIAHIPGLITYLLSGPNGF